ISETECVPGTRRAYQFAKRELLALEKGNFTSAKRVFALHRVNCVIDHARCLSTVLWPRCALVARLAEHGNCIRGLFDQRRGAEDMAAATSVLAHSGTLLGHIITGGVESKIPQGAGRWLCLGASGNTLARNAYLDMGAVV